MFRSKQFRWGLDGAVFILVVFLLARATHDLLSTLIFLLVLVLWVVEFISWRLSRPSQPHLPVYEQRHLYQTLTAPRKIPPWIRAGHEVVVRQGLSYLVGNVYWVLMVDSLGTVWLDVDGVHTPVDIDDVSQLSGR